MTSLLAQPCHCYCVNDGHALRFSVLLIPYRINITYGPVKVKALKDMHPSKAPVSISCQRFKPAKPRIEVGTLTAHLFNAYHTSDNNAPGNLVVMAIRPCEKSI